MKKLLLLLVGAITLTGCVSTRQKPETALLSGTDLVDLARVLKDSPYVRAVFKGYNRGTVDATFASEDATSSTNDPTLDAVNAGAKIFQAGQASVASSGWLDRFATAIVNPFNSLASRGTDDEAFAIEGLGASGVDAVMTSIAIIGKQPDTALLSLTSRNTGTEVYDPDVATQLSKDQIAVITDKFRSDNLLLKSQLDLVEAKLQVAEARKPLPPAPPPPPPAGSAVDVEWSFKSIPFVSASTNSTPVPEPTEGVKSFANSPSTWGISPSARLAAVPISEVERSNRVAPQKHRGMSSNLIFANRDASGKWELNHTLSPSSMRASDGRPIFYIPSEVNLSSVMVKLRWGKPALEHDHSSSMNLSAGGEFTPNLRQWNGSK